MPKNGEILQDSIKCETDVEDFKNNHETNELIDKRPVVESPSENSLTNLFNSPNLDSFVAQLFKVTHTGTNSQFEDNPNMVDHVSEYEKKVIGEENSEDNSGCVIS